MKRTTLLLEDGIYDQIKHLSQRKGISLKNAVNDLLRKGLSALPSSKKTKIKIPCHPNIAPLPGVDISDRNSLYDLLDKDH